MQAVFNEVSSALSVWFEQASAAEPQAMWLPMLLVAVLALARLKLRYR